MSDVREAAYEARLWDVIDGKFADVDERLDGLQPDAYTRPVQAGESIAAAVATVAALGGGVVRLAAGSHTIDSELILRANVSLVGEGPATVLSAAVAMRAVVSTGSAAGVSVDKLRIACNNLADYGLYSSPAPGSDYGVHAPDPCFRAQDLFIDDARVAGVYLGGQARATYLRLIRVRRAGGWGFWLRNPDSWIVDCEATTTGSTTKSPDLDQKPPVGAGFYVGTVNTVLRGCKAWYVRGYGWHIRGSRNRISECESQDTLSHGWKVEYDGNTFTNCVADTASMYDVGGKGGVDGWYIDGVGTNVFVGLQSFDRRPNGKPALQRWGYNLKKELLDSGRFLGYSGYGNVSGLVNARP